MLENVHAGTTAPAEAPAAKAPVDSVRPEATLSGKGILIPVQGVSAKDIQDTFEEGRGTDRRHEATDILAPKGTAVIAAVDGVIQKMFISDQGGNTIYQFDDPGEYSYYYAHLDRYADGLYEGMKVRRGDVIGYVGTTGNAPPGTPHLHFGIFQLGT